MQQISYASDTETGYLRLVSEDELDTARFVCMNKMHESVLVLIMRAIYAVYQNICYNVAYYFSEQTRAFREGYTSI